MVQGDMLAFHVDGEPPQLGLPDLYFVFHSSQLSDLNCNNRIGSPLATQLVTNISALYSPELYVGFTPVSPFFHFHLVYHHVLSNHSRHVAATIRYVVPGIHP